MKLTKKSILQMPSLHDTRRERGASLHVPITHLNSPTVFETHSGQLGSVIQVQGIASDTATHEELNSASRAWHHVISALDERFCFYSHVVRRKLNVSLSGQFDNDFCHTLNQRYHSQFQSGASYVNHLYITLVYKGLDSGKIGKASIFWQRLSHRVIKDARESWRVSAMAALQQALQQCVSTLSRFGPFVLGERDEALGYSELLSFLASLQNGADFIPFRFPSLVPVLSRGIKAHHHVDHRYPAGHVGQYISAKRIFFGRYIELQSTQNKSTFSACLSIKRYPDTSFSLLFDKLLHLPCEFISTHSFALESQAVAAKKIAMQLTKLINSQDQAASQMADLQVCQDDLASGRYQAGYHHHSLFLLAGSVHELEECMTQAIKMYARGGIVAFHDVLGQQAMFWSQLPGNQQFIVRSGFMTSKNFTDFVSLHNYQTGYRDKNHLGSAVTLLKTPSKTPVFFNFHAKGSGDKHDLTPGHAAIIGGNGSGKTVFLSFMDAQMTRYGGRSFFFDRDRGTEIYVRACGGVYTLISPKGSSGVSFNPFCLDDTRENRSFLSKWLSALVLKPGEDHVPADIAGLLSECVHYAYDSLSPEYRCLSKIIHVLPLNFNRWPELRQWLKGGGAQGGGAQGGGEYAYLFDHHEDHLTLNASKIGFDMTELMKQPDNIMTVVMMYLFHCIELSLDGQRVSIYLDEGWQYLNNPYWAKKLSEWLPTLRKKNCHIILSTQSPKSVICSSISAEYLDNSACSIFFCNEKADRDLYEKFNITASEFDFIKNTPREHRLFLYKQGHDSAICTLDLSGMHDELLVLSANAQTVGLLSSIRQEHGEDQRHWLPIFYEKCKNKLGKLS